MHLKMKFYSLYSKYLISDSLLLLFLSFSYLRGGGGGGHYAMPKVIKVKLKTGGPVMISCCLDQSFLLFDAPFSQGGIEYF